MLLVSLILGVAGLTVVSLFIHSYFDWQAWKRDADLMTDHDLYFTNTNFSYWYFIRYEYWRK